MGAIDVLTLATVGWLAAVGGANQQAISCPPVEPVAPAERAVPDLVWSAELDLAPVARILAGREAIYRPFPGLPGYAPEGTRIVLLRDLACLQRLGVADPGADWVAGLALLDRNLVALRVERAGADVGAVATVLRHELAHLALGRASRGRAPRWLHEGYAQFASGSWNWSEAWQLRWTFLRGSGERLRRMELDVPRDPGGARMAYMLSYTAVQELWSIAGEAGFTAFVAALGEGRTEEDAFRRVFGITEGDFVERWREGVAGRYGLLYTLSRAAVAWTLITVLLIWAGWRRRRYKRERMEELREADRREAELLDRFFDVER